MPTVVLCGMPDEKRILAKCLPGILVLSGTDKLKLPSLVPPNTTRLVCAGVCGGLSSDLKVPDIALATTMVDKRGDTLSADAIWNKKALAAAAQNNIVLHPVPYYSSGLLDEADTASQRAAMFARYGAHAIDDESRYVVAEANRRGIPFNVFRPLSDDYSETLPLEARGAIMNSDGSANVVYLLRTLKLVDLPALEKIADDYDKSLDALEKTATALASLISQG